MRRNAMTDPIGRPRNFDDLLDCLLRGEPVEVAAAEAILPQLTEGERRHLRHLWPALGAAPMETRDQDSETEMPPVERIGPYRLLRRIGAGASGAVFEAQDEVLGRAVAIKILGPDLLGTGERGERFEREVRALARLRHPNVVQVFAAGESVGLRYIAMELVAGRSLAEVLASAAAEGVKVPVANVLRWGAQIARALEAAHMAGVLHRDVKPSNIRIASDGRAVLLDFGLAREDDAATLTETGGFRGSPQYASPEQIGVEGVAIDVRTDVYALGATLYEALAGVAPFRASTREQLFRQILTEEPIALFRIDPHVPRDVATVVHAAIEKEPRRRYGSAASFAADLEAAAEGRPVSVRPPSAVGRLSRWARRHPARAAVAGLLAIGLPLVTFLGGFLLANLETIERGVEATRGLEMSRLLQEGFFEYGEGDVEVAVRCFEDALRSDAGSEEAIAGLALTQLKRGDITRARAVLSAVPDRSRAWVIGLEDEIRVKSGGPPESRAAAQPARSAVDHFVAGMVELNRYHHRELAAAAPAVEHLERAVLESRVPNPLYYVELGHAAWHAGAHAEARRVAAAIETLFPPTPERSFAVGRTLLGADPSRAWDALEAAADPPPRSIQARLMIVLRLAESMRKRSLDVALALGNKTLALDPKRAQAHHALGVVHLMRRDTDLAIERLAQAVSLNPAHAGSQGRLAEALVVKGRFPEATSPAREAVRLDPSDGAAWNTLGAALLAVGEVDEGIESLKRALELRPGLAPTLCNLGRALMRRGRFVEARDALMEGHATGSKDPRWNHPSARWLKQAERLVALDARFGEVAQGAGEAATAEERLSLAREVCVPKGDFAAAAALYAAAFQIDPTLAQSDTLLRASEAALQALDGRSAPGDAAEHAALRTRARAWFDENLVACEELARQGARDAALVRMKPWMESKVLSPTRAQSRGSGGDEDAAAWAALWDRASALGRVGPSR
jgi:tetratricopeptide (TPR) repeat protein